MPEFVPEMAENFGKHNMYANLAGSELGNKGRVLKTDVGHLTSWGHGVPEAWPGFAPGANYMDLDGAVGSRIYRNDGDEEAADWNLVLDQDNTAPAGVTMVATAGAANVCEVAISVRNQYGVLLPSPTVLEVWLSDATTGAGLTATEASGTVTAKAASGAVFGTLAAKEALVVQTLATGVFTLEITDTGKTAFKVCARVPGTGKTVVGVTLATASYGA